MQRMQILRGKDPAGANLLLQALAQAAHVQKLDGSQAVQVIAFVCNLTCLPRVAPLPRQACLRAPWSVRGAQMRATSAHSSCRCTEAEQLWTSRVPRQLLAPTTSSSQQVMLRQRSVMCHDKALERHDARNRIALQLATRVDRYPTVTRQLNHCQQARGREAVRACSKIAATPRHLLGRGQGVELMRTPQS